MNLDSTADASRTEQKTVVITGWTHGFKKVEFTKMLKDELGYSLSAAKSMTDEVVEKRRVELAVSTADRERISRLSAALGASVMDHNHDSMVEEKSCQ